MTRTFLNQNDFLEAIQVYPVPELFTKSHELKPIPDMIFPIIDPSMIEKVGDLARNDEYALNEFVMSRLNFGDNRNGYGYISAILSLLLEKYIKKVSIYSNKLYSKDISSPIWDGCDKRILDVYDDIINSIPGINCVLSGGKLTDWYSKVQLEESTGDYDIWLLDQGSLSLATIYFTKNLDYEPGENCSRFTSWISKSTGIKIQLMYHIFGDVDEVLSNFDFLPCCIAYDGVNVHWVKGCLKSIKNKNLCVRFPRQSRVYNQRLAKYIKKGFSLSTVDFNLLAISSLFGLDNNAQNGFVDSLNFDRLASIEGTELGYSDF